MAFIAIARNDKEKDADFLVSKLAALRIFPDEQGKIE